MSYHSSIRPEEKCVARELLDLGRKQVSIQGRINAGGPYARISIHAGSRTVIGFPDDKKQLDIVIMALQRVRDALRKESA